MFRPVEEMTNDEILEELNRINFGGPPERNNTDRLPVDTPTEKDCVRIDELKRELSKRGISYE